jgi:hypothetical protein
MRLFIITISLLLIFAVGFTGCTKRSEPAAAEETVKTEQEFQQEAEQEITEENMDQELSNLEQEVDSDEAGEP